jgi:excisionase family DNA binding protein
MAKSDELISVAQAAQLLKLTPQRIRNYIRDGRLPAMQVGRAFVLQRSDVLKVQRRGPGRPPTNQ